MEDNAKRRVPWGAAAVGAVVIVVVFFVVFTTSGGGGSVPTVTTTPTPPWANNPAPKVYFANMPGKVERESEFSFTVDITEVASMWGAQFDIQYNPDIITFRWAANGSINGTPPDGLVIFREGSGPDGEGLLRVAVKWNEYSEDNGGFGVNGSGTLCRLGFYAGNRSGTSGLSFPEGKGDPPGERKIMRVWNGSVYGLDLKIGTTIVIEPATSPTPTSEPQ